MCQSSGQTFGCAPKMVVERMKRGIWDLGTVVPPKNKNGNNSYEINPEKLARLAGVSVEEVFDAIKEGRPLRR